MPVPTHGSGCVKRFCYPTFCPRCRGEVFYWECTCGSKVFFDSLGDWQEHGCLQVKSKAIVERVSGGSNCILIGKRKVKRRRMRPRSNGGSPTLLSTPAAQIRPLPDVHRHAHGSISKLPLLQCEVCRIAVRSDRLDKHLRKCKKSRNAV